MSYFFFSKCACGAMTVHTDEGDHSRYWRNRRKCFLKLDLRKLPRTKDTYNCGHCCNHYGLDLSCGGRFAKCVMEEK